MTDVFDDVKRALAREAVHARGLRGRRALAARDLDVSVFDHPQEFLAEVAGVERLAADRLVDRAQLLDGEGLGHELERDRRAIEIGARAIERRLEDLGVIEGERAFARRLGELGDAEPSRLRRRRRRRG